MTKASPSAAEVWFARADQMRLRGLRESSLAALLLLALAIKEIDPAQQFFTCQFHDQGDFLAICGLGLGGAHSDEETVALESSEAYESLTRYAMAQQGSNSFTWRPFVVQETMDMDGNLLSFDIDKIIATISVPELEGVGRTTAPDRPTHLPHTVMAAPCSGVEDAT